MLRASLHELERLYPTFRFRRVEVVKGKPRINLESPDVDFEVVEMTPNEYFERICEARGKNKILSVLSASDLVYDNVIRYAKDMARGDVFDSPPTLVLPEGNQEGRHRICAYALAFGKACPVVVIRNKH